MNLSVVSMGGLGSCAELSPLGPSGLADCSVNTVMTNTIPVLFCFTELMNVYYKCHFGLSTHML